MYTQQRLLDIAAEAESTYNNNRETVVSERLIRDALACAVYLDEWDYKGDHGLRFVGPFPAELPFKKGDIVKIRKGAKIWTTNPKYRSKNPPNPRTRDLMGDKRAGRTLEVKLNRVSNGYVLSGKVYQPVVEWAGEGGYWFWCDATEVLS